MTTLSTEALANDIRREHDAAIAAAGEAIRHAIACGRLLAEAKARVAHGQWLPWLEAHTPLSPRTAQRWMKYAENAERLLNAPRVAHLSFAEADRLLAAPRTPKPQTPPAGDPEIAACAQRIRDALGERMAGARYLDGFRPGDGHVASVLRQLDLLNAAELANAAEDWPAVYRHSDLLVHDLDRVRVLSEHRLGELLAEAT